MNKVFKSTNETDFDAYGDLMDENSGAHHTGWYLNLPNSRKKEVAASLGIDSVYCIGVNKKVNKIYIQTSRKLDPRNNFVEYVVVKDEYYEKIISMITRKLTEKDREESEMEYEEKLRLAERFLL